MAGGAISHDRQAQGVVRSLGLVRRDVRRPPRSTRPSGSASPRWATPLVASWPNGWASPGPPAMPGVDPRLPAALTRLWMPLVKPSHGRRGGLCSPPHTPTLEDERRGAWHRAHHGLGARWSGGDHGPPARRPPHPVTGWGRVSSHRGCRGSGLTQGASWPGPRLHAGDGAGAGHDATSPRPDDAPDHGRRPSQRPASCRLNAGVCPQGTGDLRSRSRIVLAYLSLNTL